MTSDRTTRAKVTAVARASAKMLLYRRSRSHLETALMKEHASAMTAEPMPIAGSSPNGSPVAKKATRPAIMGIVISLNICT